MKKKVLCIVLSIVLILSISCMNVNAYGYGAYLVGMECADGADRYEWINDTHNAVACLRCSQATYGRHDNASDALYALTNCEVYIVHTHGSQTTVQYTDYDGSTSNLTTNMINNAASNSMSHLKVALFATCEGGKGGSGATNIVNSVKGRGADVVIGFKDITYVSQCNQYLTTFLNSIGEDSETYKKAMQDGVYWAKFWHWGNAGGTDTAYTRGTITKTYFD